MGWLLKSHRQFHICKTRFYAHATSSFAASEGRREEPLQPPTTGVRCCFTADRVVLQEERDFFRMIGFVLIWRNRGKICTDKHRLLLREFPLSPAFIEPTRTEGTRFIRCHWKFYVSNPKTQPIYGQLLRLEISLVNGRI